MKEANNIKVVIDGEMYELTSSEEQEYIQKIAVYIDKKIKEIYKKRGNSYMNQRLKSLFISLNIADDLFKEKEKNLKTKQEIKELSDSLSDYMDENAKLEQENSLLQEKIKLLEKELFDAKNELNEFLESL